LSVFGNTDLGIDNKEIENKLFLLTEENYELKKKFNELEVKEKERGAFNILKDLSIANKTIKNLKKELEEKELEKNYIIGNLKLSYNNLKDQKDKTEEQNKLYEIKTQENEYEIKLLIESLQNLSIENSKTKTLLEEKELKLKEYEHSLEFKKEKIKEYQINIDKLLIDKNLLENETHELKIKIEKFEKFNLNLNSQIEERNSIINSLQNENKSLNYQIKEINEQKIHNIKNNDEKINECKNNKYIQVKSENSLSDINNNNVRNSCNHSDLSENLKEDIHILYNRTLSNNNILKNENEKLNLEIATFKQINKLENMKLNLTVEELIKSLKETVETNKIMKINFKNEEKVEEIVRNIELKISEALINELKKDNLSYLETITKLKQKIESLENPNNNILLDDSFEYLNTENIENFTLSNNKKKENFLINNWNMSREKCYNSYEDRNENFIQIIEEKNKELNVITNKHQALQSNFTELKEKFENETKFFYEEIKFLENKNKEFEEILEKISKEYKIDLNQILTKPPGKRESHPDILKNNKSSKNLIDGKDIFASEYQNNSLNNNSEKNIFLSDVHELKDKIRGKIFSSDKRNSFLDNNSSINLNLNDNIPTIIFNEPIKSKINQNKILDMTIINKNTYLKGNSNVLSEFNSNQNDFYLDLNNKTTKNQTKKNSFLNYIYESYNLQNFRNNQENLSTDLNSEIVDNFNHRSNNNYILTEPTKNNSKKLSKIDNSNEIIVENIVDSKEDWDLLSNWIPNLLNRDKNSFSFKKIFKATENGFHYKRFYDKVDGKHPTLTIIKNNHNKIFGGYTNVPWKIPIDKSEFHLDELQESFIFSLNLKKKYNLKNNSIAICHSVNYGPIFGLNDIEVVDNAHINKCITNIGTSYLFDNSVDDFFGEKKYLIEDYEVWEIKPNYEN